MNALWWQYAVIGMVVAASVLTMLRKLAPTLSRRAQAALAAWLQARRSPRWQALGRRLAPPRATACGGCDACDAAADAVPPREQVVTLHRRPGSHSSRSGRA